MKPFLFTMLLATSLMARTTNPVTPAPAPQPRLQTETAKSGKAGRWLIAENNQAVFCYGPVVTLDVFSVSPKRLATQCRGASRMVPLK